MAEEKYYPQDLVVDYEGQELIKGFEGFLPTAKWDKGQWSVGYGWAAEPGETVSLEQAESEFLGRLEPYAQAVRDRLGVPVTQSVFNALVSAAWNLGVWEGELDPVFHSVNNGDNQGAANKLQEYVHAGGEVLEGLVNRRKAEGELIVADIPGISFEEGGPTAWPTFEVVYGANLAGAEGEGPEGIVLHHSAFGEGITKIAGGDWTFIVEDPNQFFANMLITKAGEVVYSGYPIGSFTPHAGSSYANMYTVGIEIENNGLGEAYTDEQIQAVVETMRGLMQEYPSIEPGKIIPHGALNHIYRVEAGEDDRGYVIGAKMPCEPCGLNVRALVEFVVGQEDSEVATAVMFEDPETENVSAFPGHQILMDFLSRSPGALGEEPTPIFEAGRPGTSTVTPSPTVTPTGLWTMTPDPTATPTVTPSPTATLFTVPAATPIPTDTPLFTLPGATPIPSVTPTSTPTPTSADMGMILRGTPTVTWTPEVIITLPQDTYEKDFWENFYDDVELPADVAPTAISPDITSTSTEVASSTVAPITPSATATSTATATATSTATSTATQVPTGTTASTATQVPTATATATPSPVSSGNMAAGKIFARWYRDKYGTPGP